MSEVKEYICTFCLDDNRSCNACDDGYERDSISWEELSQLTHATQVERFGWCMCEDPEQGQLAEGCPRAEESK